MKKSDILVFVKTYPVISRKYTETVCTAGILASNKKLVRLYPIRFRYLEGDQQFKKYQWIKACIGKAKADPRPESYTVDPNSIEVGATIPPGNTWSERHAWTINESTLFSSVEALQEAQRENNTSLGIVKPDKLKRVVFQQLNTEVIAAAIAKKNSVIKQLDLFETKKDLYILPIRIMIEFSCHNPDCNGHKMSVLDWEFGQLYRKLFKDKEWQQKIESKIREEIFNPKRETYLILGNLVGRPQTFCVLGFFWPPKTHARQTRMFP